MRLSFALFLIAALFSCRTAQKQNVSPTPPIVIKVHLNGVDAQTIGQFKLTPQLQTCTTASGVFDSGTTYTFTVVGVKKGDVCQVQLVGSKAADSQVEFFDSQADGVYFEAPSVTIYEELSGGLAADAFLEKLYSQKISAGTKTWRIDAPIKADAPIASTCTCRLSCAPAIVNDAAIVTGAGSNAATCSFDNTPGTGATTTSCTQMVVQCGSQILAGNYSPPAEALQTAGKVNTLPELKVMPATPTSEGNVEITPTINKKK